MKLWCLILPFLFFQSTAFAAWSEMNDPLSRSGFVSVEAGYWNVLEDKNVVSNPTMVYITAGFNLADEFGLKEAHESWNYVPKVGLGFGKTSLASDTELFVDALLKIRYTFGEYGQRLRFFLDAGPGFINFLGRSFELEAGGGANLYIGQALLGVNVQYKELFNSGDLKRGIVILGTLGWHYGD